MTSILWQLCRCSKTSPAFNRNPAFIRRFTVRNEWIEVASVDGCNTGLPGPAGAGTGKSNWIWSSWQPVFFNVFWQYCRQLPEHRSHSSLVNRIIHPSSFFWCCNRRFMCVFQQRKVAALRNARVFTQPKSVAYFFTQPQTPQRRLQLLTALRKQIETTSIFTATPEANSTNQSWDYAQTMAAALRIGAIRCVICCVKK